jgi:hypothetical protein
MMYILQPKCPKSALSLAVPWSSPSCIFPKGRGMESCTLCRTLLRQRRHSHAAAQPLHDPMRSRLFNHRKFLIQSRFSNYASEGWSVYNQDPFSSQEWKSPLSNASPIWVNSHSPFEKEERKNCEHPAQTGQQSLLGFIVPGFVAARASDTALTLTRHWDRSGRWPMYCYT